MTKSGKEIRVCNICQKEITEPKKSFSKRAWITRHGVVFELQRHIASINSSDGIDFDICGKCASDLLNETPSPDYKED